MRCGGRGCGEVQEEVRREVWGVCWVWGDVRSVEENKGRCEGRCGESRKV